MIAEARLWVLGGSLYDFLYFCIGLKIFIKRLYIFLDNQKYQNLDIQESVDLKYFKGY